MQLSFRFLAKNTTISDSFRQKNIHIPVHLSVQVKLCMFIDDTEEYEEASEGRN